LIISIYILIKQSLRKTACQNLSNRWEDDVSKDATKLLNTKNWHMAARHRSDSRKKTDDTTATAK
jgi:hypothetical protein